MKAFVTQIALGVAVIAAPASAQSSSAAQNQVGNSAAAAQETKYCIATETTGSRLNTQECRTKKDWARKGVDVDKLLNK